MSPQSEENKNKKKKPPKTLNFVNLSKPFWATSLFVPLFFFCFFFHESSCLRAGVADQRRAAPACWSEVSPLRPLRDRFQPEPAAFVVDLRLAGTFTLGEKKRRKIAPSVDFEWAFFCCCCCCQDPPEIHSRDLSPRGDNDL